MPQWHYIHSGNVVALPLHCLSLLHWDFKIGFDTRIKNDAHEKKLLIIRISKPASKKIQVST